MRAVVDTNILIRALIKPQGTVGPVLTRLRNGDYTLVYSQALIDELLAKLMLPRISQKYSLTVSDLDDLLALIALRGERVVPTHKVRVCRDPNDNMFIETALAGAAVYVVTGDDDLLTLKKFETVQFVTPRTFLAALG